MKHIYYIAVILALLGVSCTKKGDFVAVQDSTGSVTMVFPNYDIEPSPDYTIEQSDESKVIILRSDKALTIQVPPGMKPGTMFVIMIEP